MHAVRLSFVTCPLVLLAAAMYAFGLVIRDGPSFVLVVTGIFAIGFIINHLEQERRPPHE
jgi:hypothetical protein